MGLTYTKVYFDKWQAMNSLGIPESIQFRFASAYNWNGTDHLVIAIEHDGVTHPQNFALDVFNTSNPIKQSGNDIAGIFKGNTYVEIENFKGVAGNASRTITAWINTNKPNGEICSWGLDQSGKKWVFRVNEDSTIRVEINGGYIFGKTKVSDSKWHHVACVFDNTLGGDVNTIKLYVDGVEDQIGGQQSMAVNTDILNPNSAPVRISRGINNRYWDGMMDDVCVFDAALSVNDVKDVMYSNVTTRSNLLAGLDFNSIAASQIGNVISAQQGVVKGGRVVPYVFRGAELIKEFASLTQAPVIAFYRGSYTRTLDQSVYQDSVAQAPMFIIENGVSSKPAQLKNDSIYTANSWLKYSTTAQTLHYDTNGVQKSATPLSNDGTYTNQKLIYMNRAPQKVEIMSFVTPYGIGLDLGMEGKMWEFDVSDFVQVLSGRKYINLERGGENQEEMDIRFVFIKGTPERNVIDFRQIWPVTHDGYQTIMNNDRYQPVSYTVPANAKHAKIRSMITGHGQEGEFISRTHRITVNTNNFDWRVWTECADNPVYPQGGTWLFDRAGWCPGAATDLKEIDITDLVNPGSPVNLDYTVTSGSGDSRYIVNNQIVAYGDYNSNTDASLEYIMKPSTRVEFDRFNIACTQPQIVVKNRGKNDITSLEITYWVNASEKKTFNWTGLILSSDTAIVSLPIENMIFWKNASANVFYAEISKVNGGADDYTVNNAHSSPYKEVPTYKTPFVFNYKTNNNGFENYYYLYNLQNEIVKEVSSMGNNKIYLDTIDLATGCYRLEWYDDGGDGLDFWYWAQTGQSRGTGYLRIREGGTIKKTFNPDYGSLVIHDFFIDNTSYVEVNNEIEGFIVFPNPNEEGIFKLESVRGFSEGYSYSIFDISGRLVSSGNKLNGKQVEINMSKESKGIYMLNLFKDGQKVWNQKVTKL
jgi:hypothetical protein